MPDDIRQAPSPSLEEARHGSTTPADGVRDGRTSAPEGTPRGSAPPSEQTPRRRRRWPLAIALLLAAIVTLAVLASRLVRPRIEQAASSALGRPVRIASFDVASLARGSVAARGLAIGDPAALAVARIAVLPSWRALLDGRLVIERIAIDGLEATVEQGPDDRPAVRGLPFPPATGDDANGPPITVREIALTRATVALVPPPALRRTPVTLALDELVLRQVPTTDQGPSWEGELSGSLDGVPLTARARADRVTAGARITAEAELTGAEIDARRLVLPPGFASLSARAGGHVTYELDPERKRDRVTADLDVTALSLGGEQATSLAATRVQVQGLTLDLASGAANLGHITVEKPRIDAVLAPSGLIYPGLVPALVEAGVAPSAKPTREADAASRGTTPPAPDAAPQRSTRPESRDAPQQETTVTTDATQPREESVPEPRSRPEGPSWRVTGGQIEARAGHVVVRRDQHRAALDVPTFRWQNVASGKLGDLSLTIRASDGGTIDLDGRLGIDPPEIDARVRLDGVDLPSLGALAGSPLALARGSASGVVTLRGDPAAPAVDATLDVSSLHSAPPSAAESDRVLAVDRLDMQLAIAAGAAGDVHFRSLRLSYPYAMVARDAHGIFPLDAVDVRSAASTAATERPAAEPAPDAGDPRTARTIRIDTLAVDGGRVDFVDHTTAPAYWMGLASLTGSVADVSLVPGALGSLEIRARQDELHPLSASAKHTGPQSWQGSVSLQGMSLATLNPYLSPVLGYEAETGTLSVSLTGTLDGSKLAASSAFTLDDVGLRQTGLDVIQRQTGVPLTVALGLLEDVGGEIALEVPVEVDTRTGEYTLGSFLTQAIGRAVLGALSSPLRWLGMLFGTDGPPHALAIDPVPFTAGSTTLDQAGTARVAQIARILQSHADLDVILKAEIAASDRDAVGESGLVELAQRRVEAVRAAFASSRGGAPILPARLIVAPWTPPASGAFDAAPAVYVEVQSR